MNRRAILTTLGIMMLVAVAPVSAAPLVNGSFETGDLSGWTASDSALVAVIFGFEFPLGGGPGDPLVAWTPTDGAYFARLDAGEMVGVYTTLSQSFSATAGDVLTFDVYFDAGNIYDPNDPLLFPGNDDGYVNLIDTGASTTTSLYAQSVASVGNFGADGWTSISYTFLTSGAFQIEAGVRKVGDDALFSALGLDNVALQEANVVPEPATSMLFALGIGMATAARRRRG
jgi:hypothetical protein